MVMLACNCCANAQSKTHRFFALEITNLDGRICPGAAKASPQESCQGRSCRAGHVSQGLSHCPSSHRAASAANHQHNCTYDGAGLKYRWEISLVRVSKVHGQM